MQLLWKSWRTFLEVVENLIRNGLIAEEVLFIIIGFLSFVFHGFFLTVQDGIFGFQGMN